jgi:predicted ATPase
MVITFRPEFFQSWTGFAHVAARTLNRLGRRDCAALADQVTGGKTLPEQLRLEIIERTDGVPLFVEELTKTLLESKLLEDKGDHYALAGAASMVEVPATLHDSLMARLDQLGTSKEIAQVGSAIGRRFSLELARRVVDLDAMSAAANLDKLVTLGLASADKDGPQAIYTFKHALIQEAAHQSMLRTRRQAVHRRIAEVLKAEFAGTREAEPDILGHHFAEAGLLSEAIASLHEAGRLAAAKSANVEAVRLLGRALQLLHRSPQNRERDEIELALLVSLGPVRITTAGPGAAEAQETYQKAVEICDSLPRSAEHFTAYWGWWRTAVTFKAQHDRADRLFKLAETLNDAHLRLQAHHCQWATLFNLGEQRACCEHIALGIGIYDEGEYRLHGTLYGGHDPKVCALGERGLSMWLRGYPDQALQAATAGITHARSLQHTGSIGHAMDIEIMLHRYRQDAATVLHRAAALKAFAEKQASKDLVSKSQIFKGWALATLGKPKASLQLINGGLAVQRAIGTQEDFPVYFEMLAATYDALGEFDQALALLDEAIELVERTGSQYWSAEVFRKKGALMLRLGADDEAVDCFDRAIAIAESQSARSLLLRARTSQAGLMARQGRRKEAAELLQSVYATFTEGLDTPDLRDARTLLNALA